MQMKDNVSREWDAVVVNVGQSIGQGKDMMEAASFCWKIADVDFLNKAHYVCAQTGGVIVGVYELKGWYRLEDYNAGSHYLYDPSWKGRVAFVLSAAPAFIQKEYIGKSFGTQPTSPVKFIRSDRDHLYNKDFAPDWYDRFVTHQYTLLSDEQRVKFVELDQNVNAAPVETDESEDLDAILDEILGV